MSTAIEVKAVTPATPQIAKTQVKKCDVRLTLTDTQKVDVSKLVITATSEGGYVGELAATSETGVFEMSAKKGEVWKLGIKGTTAAVTWSIDGDSSGVCTLDGDKLTVTGATSGRYATVVGSVGGGTVKAIIRIR